MPLWPAQVPSGNLKQPVVSCIPLAKVEVAVPVIDRELLNVDVPVPPASRRPEMYAELYLLTAGVTKATGVVEPIVRRKLGEVVPTPMLFPLS